VRTAEAVTKPKGARNADETFIESLKEPVRIFLRDRSIGHSLLNAGAHFGCVRRLDRILHILHVYICILS
jgi:hypothetical protein